jgi:hypothetical protein
MMAAGRIIRWSTTGAVIGLAAVAAVASDEHAYDLVRAHGEVGWTARLVPLTVDGLIYASSMVMLDLARRKAPIPALARWCMAESDPLQAQAAQAFTIELAAGRVPSAGAIPEASTARRDRSAGSAKYPPMRASPLCQVTVSTGPNRLICLRVSVADRVSPGADIPDARIASPPTAWSPAGCAEYDITVY